MQDTAYNTADGAGFGRDQGCRSRMGKRRWSGLEIAVVVGSFVVFWPLGIAALAVKLTKGELWRGASEMAPPWQGFKAQEGFDRAKAWKGRWQHDVHSSGNAAFDEYRKTQLDKLEAERRKLDDERKAFADHLSNLRKAKDKEEFDRFMAERQSQQTGNQPTESQAD